ncbi:MAG: hypothetical protein V1742_05880, partial [Pseudomonadota bacterium]
MTKNCRKKDVGQVMAVFNQHGFEPRIISTAPRIILGVVEEMDRQQMSELKEAVSVMEGVEGIEPFGTSWKLASRAFRNERTAIRVGRQMIGGE